MAPLLTPFSLFHESKKAELDAVGRSRLPIVEVVDCWRLLAEEDRKKWEEKAAAVQQRLPAVQVHPEARCLSLGQRPAPPDGPAAVAVLSGGSSDRSVVCEIALALQLHGIGVDLVMDVGVAGLHRLLDQLPRLETARVLIACAGMEGALPTVLTGLVPQPVIGVPVSVGYGVSQGGRAALDGMLASCAPGLCVVNIDNGYGAAMAALRMLRSG